MLVGVAGTMALLDKVRSIACGSCSSTNEVLDQLSGLLSAREDKHDTDALVVFPGGLIELDPAGGQYWVTSSLWAIGCGSYSALSYLRGWADGLGKRESELRPEDAVRAIEHVATVNTDVGDGCQVERIGEPNGSHG